MLKNLGVHTFPDPVSHFGAPWRPYWILQALQAVSECPLRRQAGIENSGQNVRMKIILSTCCVTIPYLLWHIGRLLPWDGQAGQGLPQLKYNKGQLGVIFCIAVGHCLLSFLQQSITVYYILYSSWSLFTIFFVAVDHGLLYFVQQLVIVYYLFCSS